ncbi:MAG TPA: NUDIX domain-containing protein [Thermoanaerobaculia bacterium]|nr:NUDIX domain-containing protein [Thermoanaerobaculia bacterium]
MKRAEALLQELERYEPADEAERVHRRELIELLSTSADPFSRDDFTPGHVTASAFIVDDAARLLLHHHRRLGRWLQMGGHVEPGETPAGAALREGMEESGLRDLRLIGLIDLDVHVIPEGRGEPAHRHFDVRYLARTEAPASIAIDAAESVELKWTGLEEAASLMGSAESLRVIRKITGVLCTS